MKQKINVLITAGLLVFALTGPGTAGEKNAIKAPEVFRLGEVVVTGEKQVANLATTITEVSMEDIRAKGATSAAQALEFLPGVFVRNGGKGETHVSIRGFEQRQVKILIDGVPARENYFGTVDLAMLPAESISKIRIIKGASSVLYGANTMGGVINIITKKGGKIPRTAVTAAFGDYDTAHYTASHGGSAGDFNYWLSGGYQTSDGFRLSKDFNPNDPVVGMGTPYNEDGGKRDLSDYLKKSLNMKIGYDSGGESSLYLSFDYVDNERGIPTFNNRYWAYNKWRQWQLNLAGEHRVSRALKLKTRLFYVKHDDGISDVSWDADHKTQGRKWFEQSYYDDASVGGEIQASVDLAPWNTLRVGVNYMEDKHKQGDRLGEDCWSVIKGRADLGWQPEEEYTAHVYTIGVEDEFRPFDRLSMVAGVSYDVFEPIRTSDQPEPDRMDTFNPQFGLIFEMTDTTRFHASMGRKTRFPALKELYSRLAGGNPDLNPEKAMAYEVGVTQLFPGNATGNISFFYNDIDDLIEKTRIGGKPAYVNIREAVIFGAEAGFRLPLSSAMDASVNYTFLSTKDKSNNDRDLEARPRHRLNLGLCCRFAFGLRADIQAAYNCRQFWKNNDNQWKKLSDHFLVNAKLTQSLEKLVNCDAEIFVQSSNLLDEDYYETNGPEPGFNFMAGMTMRF